MNLLKEVILLQFDLGKVVGDKGDTGNGIASITLYSTSGKVKTYRITYTDGSTFDFQVRDGNDASVTVDSSLSSTSTNPVQNKIINSALNGKASSSHSHSISDVSNLQTTLDGKASSSHNHNISEVNNLQSSLDGKANSNHTHTVSNITDFPSIPSKTSDLTNDTGFITSSSVPNPSSTTPSADTTSGSVGTGTTWARSNHTHPKSSLYAEASHTHTISNVTDLQTTLDSKASSSHTHKKLEKTEITTGTLDDYTDTGWYSYTTGNSANITNVPEVVGSVMEVLDDYGDGKYVIQKVYTLPSSKDSAIYYRQKYYTNGWGSWKKLMSDYDVNALIGDAITYINGTGGS